MQHLQCQRRQFLTALLKERASEKRSTVKDLPLAEFSLNAVVHGKTKVTGFFSDMLLRQLQVIVLPTNLTSTALSIRVASQSAQDFHLQHADRTTAVVARRNFTLKT